MSIKRCKRVCTGAIRNRLPTGNIHRDRPEGFTPEAQISLTAKVSPEYVDRVQVALQPNKPSSKQSLTRRLLGVLLSFSLIQYGCAVTGPRVTRQEEEAARGQLQQADNRIRWDPAKGGADAQTAWALQQADYRIWWDHRKRLFRVSDHFAWRVDTPGAPYRNSIGILPVLRKSASSYELALYEALGNPRDGTVLHVSAGSPGERAGIDEGDVIVAIDDRNVNAFSVGDLADFATKGQTRRFSYVKRNGGDVKTVTITPSRKLDIDFLANPSQEVNASASSYNNGTNLVTVSYGLIDLLPSDDELAVFVGHEVFHILKNHHDQTAAIQAVGTLVYLGIAIVGAARGVNTDNIRGGVSKLTDIVKTGYSREQEREADYLGLYAAHQAGFNIEAAPTAWERLAVATPEGMNDDFRNDHPAHPERFVRIQKTVEEIRHGRTLQQAWFGDSSETQIASSDTQPRPIPTANTRSVASTDFALSNAPMPSVTKQQTAAKPGNTKPPVEVANIPTPPLATVSAPPEQRPITKTYASLVQYDGPKIKSGITLDAQFLDDGSGNGEALVNDVGNRMLKGTFTTIQPGARDWPKPKILDRATLNKLQIRNDRPWVISTVSNADTALECVYGETQPLGQTKGACRDNYGNRYSVNLLP